MIGIALVAVNFNWKRLAVIYTSNTFGTDSYELFKIYSEFFDFTVVSAFSVSPGLIADTVSRATLRLNLAKMKELDALIFVFLIDDISAAKEVWMTAYEMGVITFRTPTIGMHDITNPDIWKGATAAQAEIWRGLLSGARNENCSEIPPTCFEALTFMIANSCYNKLWLIRFFTYIVCIHI